MPLPDRTTHRFDVHELLRRLDTIRRERDISWNVVARECGINSSAFSRVVHGTVETMHVDTIVSLLAWMGAADALGELVVPRPAPAPKLPQATQSPMASRRALEELARTVPPGTYVHRNGRLVLE